MKRFVKFIILFTIIVGLSTPAKAFFWKKEKIDSANLHGTSLTLDSVNNPHICYKGDDVLKYAYWDGSAWQIEVVDNVETSQ